MSLEGIDDLVRPNVHLGALTTYKLGGPARWFAEVATAEDLERLAGAVRGEDLPILVLGRGSNVVIGEGGFPGLVVRLGGRFTRVEHLADRIEAGGGASLPMLARAAVREGRLGLEFFVGIPGSVRGAVRQNAGCHGSETVDVLLDADVLDLATGVRRRRDGRALDLSYRHSNVKDSEVVLAAGFRFEAGDPAAGEERMREITRWRRDHQPGGTLNAGSVFKNPPGDAAGRIIDALGLKGFAVGGAVVSERHANFFVARPGATPSDVRALVQEVRRRVHEATGIRLEPEIRFVGDFASGADS